jgi:TolA-binding protein
MTDLESETVADPVLARIGPRWSGARTERNLAATFDRITRARRVRRGSGLFVLAAVVGAVIVARGLERPPASGDVAAQARTSAPPARALRVDAPASRALRSADGPAGAGATAPGARPVVVKVARIDVKIASARIQFREQVARRQYAAAYRSLVAVPSVAEHSAEDLMLAADAARLSGHPAEAVPYFERLLRQYARDARAPVAAFTLGRILLSQLGRPAEAADAFALARHLSPAGALAPDALAREVEAAGRAGDTARARGRAQDYLSLYPTGRRAVAVRRAGGLE